jgi:hypothetical protein
MELKECGAKLVWINSPELTWSRGDEDLGTNVVSAADMVYESRQDSPAAPDRIGPVDLKRGRKRVR